MRFSSFYRWAANRAPGRRLGAVMGLAPSASSGSPARWSRLLAGWIILSIGFGLGSSVAQPPGTAPPKQVFDPDSKEQLPIGAFMFLSESGNLVMVPGLTWEEIQRLQDLDSGMDAARQLFIYQSLDIEGTSQQGRAELDVVMRLTIEPTGGRWISIPLRMGNFHRLAPPDVSGVDEYFMTLAPDGSGHVLFVKSDSRHEAMLRMRVSARVETSSAARTLDFRLPDVPTNVQLIAAGDDVLGEVIGGGDEAIRTESFTGRRTKFSIYSGGGTFSLRWGKLVQSSDNLPLLEVESRVSVQWDSPQDQPIASVRLTIRNVRGSINSFQLRLPNGSVVLEPPRLGTSGQMIKLGAATNDGDGEIRDVLIPKEEQQQTIDLNFELQLAHDRASVASPLGFRVPEIVGSLRHRGELEIRTGGDYRLRWRAKPWIRTEIGELQEEGTSGRTYRFRFDRASFELPLWLGEKERQLRLISQSEIVIRQSVASLDMTIEVNGQTSDGRLQFDDATWQVNAIEDLESGQPLQSFMADLNRIIEFSSNGSEQPALIRIRAQHPLESDQGSTEFPLPRVVEIDESGLVHNATVDIVNDGRTMLVVDLEASTGLSRIMRSVAETNVQSPVTRFRVTTRDAPAVVVGAMIDQPLRITLESDATIALDGRQLRTTVDWTVFSELDLEGQLPIRIPVSPLVQSAQSPNAVADELFADQAAQEQLAGTAAPLDSVAADSSEPWIVTVDDVPAIVRAVDDDHYVLSSERLTSGSMKIRWRHAQTLRSGMIDGSIESVSLPRPDFPDVTISGAMMVALGGNQQLNLTSLDSPSTSELRLDKLPREPIRLRLQSRLTALQELAIRQTILRTIIGRNTRHEQVLSRIQGGESFRVDLPDSAQEVKVEAFIDKQSVPVRREGNALIVSLPGDKASHTVDLRVWVTAVTPSSLALIKPTVKLPIGAGLVFWQIVTPQDGHAVWASPTLGRSMTWRFNDWQLRREPSHDDQDLTAVVGSAVSSPAPRNQNRYLYVGSDLRSFQVAIVSRSVLWICIGSFVLITAVMLTNFPQSRHPLTAVAAAVLFAGLLAIAPDAAVLAGQFGIIALVLVVVMTAIRVLVTPARSDRVFSSHDSARAFGQPPSTRSLKKSTITPEAPGVSSTQALAPPSPTEASS